MTDTAEILKGSEPHKTFNPSAYHEHPKDKPREQERREPWFFQHLKPEVRKREAASQLETYVRALAAASAEKPRWQKIIEHANSLADEMGMPHERFYWMALAEFIEKLENARITNELNEAYKNIDREEDVAFLNRLVSYYDPRLADE